MRVLLVLIISVLLALTTSASEPTYLYKTKLVQAAPGKLLEVIDLLKASQAGFKDAGDERPLLMRHSQGDHWDLLVLIPMKSYADYFSLGERPGGIRVQRAPSSVLNQFARDEL